MTKSCHFSLRQGLSSRAETASWLIAGQRKFPAAVDDGQTESAVFSSYFDLCAGLLGKELEKIFASLFEIAIAQRGMVRRNPAEWAALQARMMVADESWRIPLWLKATCESQLPPDDDLEWTRWRAPKWIYMKPFANLPYDRTTAWDKVSESNSLRILDVVEDRFNQRLIMNLDKVVAAAHVELAKRATDLPAEGRRQPELAKRRTIVKNNPSMCGEGLCVLFDTAEIPLTKGMKEAGTWSKAWKDPFHKHSIEALISRDRKSK